MEAEAKGIYSNSVLTAVRSILPYNSDAHQKPTNEDHGTAFSSQQLKWRMEGAYDRGATTQKPTTSAAGGQKCITTIYISCVIFSYSLDTASSGLAEH